MFFELEDIKRRHSVYFDTYNVGSWVQTPDNTLRWNIARGSMIGIASNVISETWHNFFINWNLLLRDYRPPETLKQLYIFTKSTLQMENFKKSMKSRLQCALTAGGIDWAARIVAFREVNNGWQNMYGTVEYGFLRRVPGSMLAAAITAPVGVPFEIARMAYYADKTFPKELQKGYKSYFNALWRIPFEEGPYYLFKNSFPIYARNFIQTLTLFYTFDFLKDKTSFMWRANEMPYYPCKIFNAALSTYLALLFSYPFYFSRIFLDFFPKPPTGDIFKGNYRRAASWMWFSKYMNNFFPGFVKNYAIKAGPMMFSTLLFADNFGMFSYWRVDYFSGPGTNSWEDSFY